MLAVRHVLHPARRRVLSTATATDPDFVFVPVSGRGVVRSWTVVRQSFLPGFDDDLPFVLVDVELDEQADLRIIGRLRRRPRRRTCTSAIAVVVAFEDLAPGVVGPGVRVGRRRERPDRRRRDQVAIVGYAHSPGASATPAAPLGACAIDTARAAIADAGLDVEQIDGFTTGALFPTAGAHTIEDGVSIVSSNWLAEHLGINPRYAAGFQGYGQIPGAVALAVNAVASGAADYVLMHRALHNPTGQLPRQPDARSARRRSSGPRRRATSGRWR